MSRTDTSIETESKVIVAYDRDGNWRSRGVTAKTYGVSFRGDKNVLKLSVVMVARIYGDTENH